MGTTYYGQHSGIVLASGFLTKNPVTVAANGTITAGAGYNGDAVYATSYAWTLANLGTIVGAGSVGAGIALEAGGAVVNGASGATGALIEGEHFGIYIRGSGNVVNYGTIAVSATNTAAGIFFAGSPGTVVNLGTIEVTAGANAVAAAIVVNGRAGSSAGVIHGNVQAQHVTNYGAIDGAVNGNLANLGTIASVAGGGFVTNGRSGSTAGLIEAGVTMNGTLVNFGVIDGGAGVGAPGKTAVAEVVNFGTISGNVSAGTGALTNSGLLQAGSSVTAAMITNSGTIDVTAGGAGVGGVTANTIDNSGTIRSAQIVNAFTINNLGSIETTGSRSVYAPVVLNGSSGAGGALIEGGPVGVYVRDSRGTVLNFATIAATGSVGFGIALGAGGTVANFASGYIAGGVSAGAVATIANYGLIVHAAGPGILLGAGGTVVEAGTVAGGNGGAGIFFGGTGGNLLVLEAGYAIAGGVYGAAGATNTLELQGSAAAPVRADVNGLGLANFHTAAFAPGAGNYATLVIRNPATLSGTIVGFAGPHDAIDLPNLSDANNDATVGFDGATDVLTVKGDNGTLALPLDDEPYSGFAVRNDGSGGTLVTVKTQPTNVFSGTYTNGIVLSNPATQNPATVTATGYVTNTASAGIALYGSAGFAWTVSNFGTIERSNTAGPAVELASGGTFVNQGAVLGAYFGEPAVVISGGAGALTNAGSIEGSVTIAGGAGALANSGTLRGGIYLDNGGNVVNAANGLLAGRLSVSGFGGHLVTVFPAVNIGGSGGVVTNLGDISSGVVLAAGEVVNGQSGSSGAFIAGPGGGDALTHSSAVGAAVSIAGAGTVTNFGTMTGNPGVLIAGSGTVTNYGTVLAPGNVQNDQTIAGSSSFGIELASGGLLSNSGSIAGLGSGVVMLGAGSVDNAGAIAGTGTSAFGLYLGAGGITVVNRGAITGQYGVGFGAGDASGDTLVNAAGIAGGAGGVVIDGPGYLGNTGSIAAASGTGVYITANGVSIVNSGSIGGTYGLGTGPGDTAGDTVVNAGTIAGNSGLAVALGAPGDRLVIDPGAVFVGAVYGANSTIELAAGAGSLSGLGANFAGFATVRVDAGADWAVSGGGSRFVNDGTVTVDGELGFAAVLHDAGAPRGAIVVGDAATAEFTAVVGRAESVVFRGTGGTVLLDRPRLFHAVVSGFAAGDTIDLVGRRADGLTFVDHQLILTNHGNAIADLRLAGRYRQSEFSLSPDGNGGTDITLNPATAESAFWTLRG